MTTRLWCVFFYVSRKTSTHLSCKLGSRGVVVDFRTVLYLSNGELFLYDIRNWAKNHRFAEMIQKVEAIRKVSENNKGII